MSYISRDLARIIEKPTVRKKLTAQKFLTVKRKLKKAKKVNNTEKKTKNKPTSDLEKQGINEKKTDIQEGLKISGKPSEEIKEENKFSEPIGKMSNENFSRTALTGSPIVYHMAKNQKSTPSLDARSSSFKSSDRVFGKSGVGTCSSRLNLTSSEKKPQLADARKGLKVAGKSLSFDMLKFSKGTRQLSKSFSVENSKDKPPISGFTAANKKINTSRIEKFVRETNPVGHHSNTSRSLNQMGYAAQPQRSFEKRNSVPDSIFTDRGQMCQKKGDVTEEFSDIAIPSSRLVQNEDRTSQFYKLESLMKIFKNSDFAKDLSEQYWKKTSSENNKRNLNLCQCLHFHTEDGIKNIRTQMNQDISKFGQKLNRLSYFSKKDDDIDEEPEDETEIMSKAINENVTVRPDLQKYSEFWKSYSEKPEPKKRSKPKVKNKEKSKKRSSQEQLKYVLKWKQNKDGRPVQILGKAKPIKKKDPKKEEAKKLKKQADLMENLVLEKPHKTFSDQKMEYQRALEELDILELLFLKLNIVENALIQQRMLPQQRLLRESPDIKKLRATLAAKGETFGLGGTGNSRLIYPDIDSAEFIRRRKNLKNAIIQHVRNWLLLDFSDN